MRFEEYSYLWPPRPEKAVPDAAIPFYETQGYWAQIKMNGTCSVLAVAPDRTIHAMSRHNDEHKLWKPSPHTADAFRDLPGDGWYVFVAELLHSKVKSLKDINYIHDVLVADGDYLVGETLAQRQQRLADLFEIEDELTSHYTIDAHTWLVKNHTNGFADLYAGLDADHEEGLVFKRADAPLALCSRASSNADWQVKTRRIHKNYSF